MTRLKEEWLLDIERGLDVLERELMRKARLDFAGIAAVANGISAERVRRSTDKAIAVVPITSGEGVIGGFSDAVAAVMRRVGFDAFVTACADVAGIAEAYEQGAGMLFMADDSRYVGIDLVSRRVSDNNAATARGFAAVLEGMSGEPLDGKDVLVIGCGIVGRLAAVELRARGAAPVLHDKDRQLQAKLCRELACAGLSTRIREYRLVLDATNEGGWLTADMLHEQALISAPGVPLSLDADALRRHGERTVHDLLYIGTLAMLGELC